MLPFSEQLKEMFACQPALDWVGDKTLAQAWRDCLLPTWMAWIVDNGRGRLAEIPTDKEVIEASIVLGRLILESTSTTSGPISLSSMLVYENMLDGCAWEYSDERLARKNWAYQQLGEKDFYSRDEKPAVRWFFESLWSVYGDRRHPPQDPAMPMQSFERLVYYATEALRGPASYDGALVKVCHLLRVNLPLHLG